MSRILLSLACVLLLGGGPPKEGATRHLKVRVTLRNGSKLTGVVRNSALYEVLREGRFERTVGPRVPGAGFRLWYVTDSPGYLFVRHEDVKKFEKIAVLTTGELFSLEKDLRKRAGIIVPRYRGKTPGEEGGEGAPPPPSGEEPAPKGKPVKEAPAPEAKAPAPEKGEGPAVDLLRRFPPEEGWVPERREEIERRKWVLGVFPSEEEKAFLESYPLWKKAYDAWLEAMIERKADEEASGGSDG